MARIRLLTTNSVVPMACAISLFFSPWATSSMSADSFRARSTVQVLPLPVRRAWRVREVGVVNDALGSPSSGPLVAPAMIALPGMVS